MKLTSCLALCAGLGLAACSGRTVQLDHDAASAAGSAGAASKDDDGKPSLLFKELGVALTAWELHVDDTRVYWQTQDGTLQSCRKDDCQPSVVTYTKSSEYSRTYLNGILEGTNVFSSFAISEGNVAWLANPPRGTIYVCPSAGCGEQPTRLVRDPAAGGAGQYQGLTADDGKVYWLSSQDLYRCAVQDCSAGPERLAFAQSAMPTFFGADAFWIERTDLGSRIRVTPKEGSADAITFVERTRPVGVYGVEAIGEIAVSSQYVYWLDDTSRLLRCPRAGCEGEPAVLDAGAGDKAHLRVDELGVYWLATAAAVPTPTDGMHFCPHTGCPSPTALSGFDELGTYALDDDFIYFTAHVPSGLRVLGGDIQRRRKPSL